MKPTISDLENWPKTKGGQPIFQCSEDGIFYANLIFGNEKEIKVIRKAMENARQDVHEMRAKGSKNLSKMYHMAVKAQFFRECLDELGRIHNNKFFA